MPDSSDKTALRTLYYECRGIPDPEAINGPDVNPGISSPEFKNYQKRQAAKTQIETDGSRKDDFVLNLKKRIEKGAATTASTLEDLSEENVEFVKNLRERIENTRGGMD